jgi:hypothetical protein
VALEKVVPNSLDMMAAIKDKVEEEETITNIIKKGNPKTSKKVLAGHTIATLKRKLKKILSKDKKPISLERSLLRNLNKLLCEHRETKILSKRFALLSMSLLQIILRKNLRSFVAICSEK